MSCFRKNVVIRSDFVAGSGNFRRLFFRKAGTLVRRRGNECYVAREDAIIAQWAGSPEYDSGYHAKCHPATMSGLKAAHADMDDYQM